MGREQSEVYATEFQEEGREAGRGGREGGKIKQRKEKYGEEAERPKDHKREVMMVRGGDEWRRAILITCCRTVFIKVTGGWGRKERQGYGGKSDWEEE